MGKDRLVVAWTCVALTVACSPTVGGTNCGSAGDGGSGEAIICNRTDSTGCNTAADGLARTIVTRGCGEPAYAGQALVLENCATCHVQPGSMPNFEARKGAPAGLDFDPFLVDSAAIDAIASSRHLQRAQANIHRHRDLIYAQVVQGDMPPPGSIDQTRPSAWRMPDGTPLPHLNEARGQEILRHWLSCGSPVVETTVDTATDCLSNSDCVVTNFCDEARGECVRVGDVVEGGDAPTTANWSSIWCAVQSRCGGAGCHIGSAAGSFELPAGTSSEAYSALINAESASGSSCTLGTPYIVPRQPDMSLFVQKIEGPDCGGRMPLIGDPLSAAQVTAIRQWVTAGAMND